MATAFGCDSCKDLVGRFHCAVCGFDGGRVISHTTVEKEKMMADFEIHTFAHCKACFQGGQTPRIAAGLSTTGVVIQCGKHGLICHFSPEELTQQLALGPRCHCCPGGMHRS